MDDPPVDRAQVFGETPQAVERIAPGFFADWIEAEHLARYRWAARWVEGKSVLDVACGTGYGSDVLRRAGALRVVSVDLSAPALGFARRKYPGPLYVRADALTLPFKGESFDVVNSLETIEHLPDPVRFLMNVRPLLRVGGSLVLSMPNRAQTDGLNPYHVHEMTLPELLAILDQSDFDVVRRSGQHWRLGRRRGLWRVQGMGRLAWEIGRLSAVFGLPRGLGLDPLYWCLLAHAR